MLNVVSSNLPVPTIEPLRYSEPVIFTLPVNSCKSSSVSPNLVEPDSYKTEDVIYDVCISSAVNVPLIYVSPFTLKVPSDNTEALTAPFTILFNCKPVTPEAGILYNPEPSPLNEPVNIDEVTG